MPARTFLFGLLAATVSAGCATSDSTPPDALALPADAASAAADAASPTDAGAAKDAAQPDAVVAVDAAGSDGGVSPVGQTTLLLKVQAAGPEQATVLDASGNPLQQFFVNAYPLVPVLAPKPDAPVPFRSEDGTVQGEVVRRVTDGGGTAGTLPYVAVSFALAFEAESFFADGYDELLYTGTHHNMNDSLRERSEAA